MNTQIRAIFAALLATAVSTPIMADSDDVDISALKAQIETLQERVAALEARDTFTSFMPNFAERFHVMHRAGEAGDWAVASHELEEMKRMSVLSTSIDAKKGKLLTGMMGPSFGVLEDAIEHGDFQKFENALTQTVSTCNACHEATGSAFVEVTVNARDSMSLRHPHRLMPRSTEDGHHHGKPAAMGDMMGSGTMEQPAHEHN
ncbi:MAG: hypothetical protein OEQ39_10820 [Gammaproteobacteria bacterium]|nr:hypothetical protein [Gammaproteobacteria bacterium]MDH3465021.1 hypothetical protein [Gammaproteobacteria bacterium]